MNPPLFHLEIWRLFLSELNGILFVYRIHTAPFHLRTEWRSAFAHFSW